MATSSRPRAAIGEPEQGSAQADTRARLLAAAARVYAQHGFAGATTRLIAKEADLNEVTLFRHFRSKDALVDEAVRVHTTGELPVTGLPAAPSDPEQELAAWCAEEIERLRDSGELVRQCFASAGEHPEHLREVTAGITNAADVLRAYVGRLVKRGLVGTPEHAEAAASMLVAVLVSDALARQHMPRVYPRSSAAAPAAYTRAFLAALGFRANR